MLPTPPPFQDLPLVLLPIDVNSTIASDIDKIWHSPETQEICVALTQTARCPHPALLGRLSGPGLAILEWKEQRPPIDDTAVGTVLCGGYDHYWLEAGIYFVEIIILFCNDFGVNALLLQQPPITNRNMTAWLEAEHKDDCVEDTKRNRITSKEEGRSIIHIPTSTIGRDSYRIGRWIRKPGLPSRPLFTRFQPMECFHQNNKQQKKAKYKEGSPTHLYCISVTERDHDGTVEGKEEVTGLFEYEFQWNMKVSEQQLVEKLRQRLHDASSLPKICAIGDSNSRFMVKQTLPELNLTGLFEYIQSPWIAPHGIVKKIEGQNCDLFFVQVGHWPASAMTHGRPFSFGRYRRALKLHIQNILKYNPHVKIYLPTIDPTPLMALTHQCNKEWRTPTMLDGYSYVNQMIVTELNTTSQVRYIDTDFIIYTHWDGGPDWYHLLETVRSRKTIYMAAIMLGETEWFE